MPVGVDYPADVIRQYENLKVLGDKAVAQVSDEELVRIADPESNSIAIIMRHVGGNLRSRFSDCLTTDGEKPTATVTVNSSVPADATRAAIVADWNSGFDRVRSALRALKPTDLEREVHIAASG